MAWSEGPGDRRSARARARGSSGLRGARRAADPGAQATIRASARASESKRWRLAAAPLPSAWRAAASSPESPGAQALSPGPPSMPTNADHVVRTRWAGRGPAWAHGARRLVSSCKDRFHDAARGKTGKPGKCLLEHGGGCRTTDIFVGFQTDKPFRSPISALLTVVHLSMRVPESECSHALLGILDSLLSAAFRTTITTYCALALPGLKRLVPLTCYPNTSGLSSHVRLTRARHASQSCAPTGPNLSQQSLGCDPDAIAPRLSEVVGPSYPQQGSPRRATQEMLARPMRRPHVHSVAPWPLAPMCCAKGALPPRPSARASPRCSPHG